MNRQEFLVQLRKGLSGLSQDDIEECLTFYSEAIDDRMEEGLSEEEAISAVGFVDEIVTQVVTETSLAKITKEKMSIKRSTGDIRFDGSDATEIFVETDTGDVTGTLISEKVFIARTDTGRINVPKTTNGGKCEINTDTGDIKLEIK